MKWSIYEEGEARYIIAPSNSFIYFWWSMYHNFKTLFFPFPYYLMRYYKTIENARKELNKIRSLGG